MDREDRHSSYIDEKPITKTLSEKKWMQQHPNFNQSDSFHILNRPGRELGTTDLMLTCTVSSRLV